MQLLSHLAIGIILAVPFVHKEKKLYFFIVGVIGSLFPDIDLLISFLDHRSITHSFWFWLLVTTVMIYVLILLDDSFLLNTVILFQLAWFSHLILDFGYTQAWFFDIASIEYIDGWFFNLSAEELLFIDTYIAIPIILGILFYYMLVKQFAIGLKK